MRQSLVFQEALVSSPFLAVARGAFFVVERQVSAEVQQISVVVQQVSAVELPWDLLAEVLFLQHLVEPGFPVASL